MQCHSQRFRLTSCEMFRRPLLHCTAALVTAFTTGPGVLGEMSVLGASVEIFKTISLTRCSSQAAHYTNQEIQFKCKQKSVMVACCAIWSMKIED